MRSSRGLTVTLSLITILSLAFSGLAAAQSPTPPSDAPASAGPSASAEAQDTVAPLVTWQRTDKAPRFGKVKEWPEPPGLRGIASLPSGDIALVGGRGMFGGGAGAEAWQSTDGLAWEPVTMRGAGAEAREVSAYPGGFVAIGERRTPKGLDGLIWTSATGEDWSAPTIFADSRLQDILVTTDGLEIVGTHGLDQSGYGYPTIWHSEDGVTWGEPIQLGDKLGGFHQIAIAPDGSQVVIDAIEEDGSLWRSEDGEAWERLAPSPTPDDGSRRSYRALTSVRDGVVMEVEKGSGRKSKTELWHSLDGITWTPVAAPDRPAYVSVTGPWGSVRFGYPTMDRRGRFSADEPGLQYWSQDGRTWCTTSDRALAGVQVNGATVTEDGRILVAGTTESYYGPPVTLVGEVSPEALASACQPLSTEGLDVTPVTLGQPVVIAPSMVSGCAPDSGDAVPAVDSNSGEPLYCASDLIAAGATSVRPAKALAAAGKLFAGGGCVKPAGGTVEDRPLLCLEELATAWRYQQRKTGADGRVSQAGFR